MAPSHKPAIIKLETGPAIATQSISRLGDLSALKLTGTGLAQPKTKPEVKYKKVGTKIVPTGSI